MKSLELFAGAGGLALGTARAGFQHVVVLDWDHNACQTLRRNKAAGVEHAKDWDVIECDVRHYDFRPHQGKIDFVCGGPPCQPFSIGGKHLGHADDRNMFSQAVRAVRETQPKAFVFENVKGLLRRSFANYYAYILHQLRLPEVTPKGDEEWPDHLARLERHHTKGKYKGLQYNVVYQLLNAADYGVPQKRERVLIVGIRSDLGIEFSFPHATHSEDALLYKKWVTGEYWERHRMPRRLRGEAPRRVRRHIERLRQFWVNSIGQPWQTVRDAISGLPRIGIGATSSQVANHFYNSGARSYAGHTGSCLDEPAKTLKAGDHGVPGGENTVILDNGQIRYFSVRECARLQTFPDDWVLEGSWTESMRQLGNAVPVRLAEIVATGLNKRLQLSNMVTRAFQNALCNQRLNRSLIQSGLRS